MSFYSIKNTFTNMTTDFIRILKYSEAVTLMMTDTGFPNLKFLLEHLYVVNGSK